MARVVVLGAGIAGHTAALFLRRRLPRSHHVIVVSPKDIYKMNMRRKRHPPF